MLTATSRRRSACSDVILVWWMTIRTVERTA
jgi:hypothetical protein